MDERLRGPRVRKIGMNRPAPLRFMVDTRIYPRATIHTERKAPVFRRRFSSTPPTEAIGPQGDWLKEIPSGQEPDTHMQDFIETVLRKHLARSLIGSKERAWREADLNNWLRKDRPTQTRPKHGRQER